MENIIFYSLLLVCIILLFIVGYNFTKINKYKSNAQFWQESYNDVIKRVKELTKQNEQIELLKAAIESKEETISDQSKALQKQADEITILKEQVESLTNHLQERAKQFDPLAELDKIEIKKIMPDELMDQTKMIHNILSQLDKYNDLYPKDAPEFNNALIKAIQGTLKENEVNVLAHLKDLIPRDIESKEGQRIRNEISKKAIENIEKAEVNEAFGGVGIDKTVPYGVAKIAESFKVEPKKKTKKK